MTSMLLRCRPVLRSPAFCCRRALTAQAAIYTETGNPQDVVRVVEREVPDSADGLEPGQVVVRMLAAPVNPSDLNQIEGTYPVRGRFAAMALRGGAEVTGAVGGNEGVGEVVAVATRGADGVQLGDWVVPRRAGEFGTWCTHTVAAASGLHVVPRAWRESVRAADVACLKVNPSTAYRMLRDFAELRAGDYVIQNGANSGVGRAVIQLARHWGIRTINVVRDRPQLAALQRELQELGADIVVTDRQLGDEGVKRQLRSLGAPVRLGFNCVGGRATLQMTKHISAGGTLVSYGGMSRQPVTLPTSLLLFRDLRARGFWMNRWYAGCEGDPAREAAMMAMWQDILRLVRDGDFATQPLAEARWSPLAPLADAQHLVGRAVAWGPSAKHAFIFDTSGQPPSHVAAVAADGPFRRQSLHDTRKRGPVSGAAEASAQAPTSFALSVYAASAAWGRALKAAVRRSPCAPLVSSDPCSPLLCLVVPSRATF